MTIPSEVANLILLVSGNLIWIIVGAFLLASYTIVGLLTWSFVKPLKYLGIPTICVGSLFIFIRISAGVIARIFGESIKMIGIILPAILRPILLNGIICLIVGIIMVVAYAIIIKTTNKKDKAQDSQNTIERITENQIQQHTQNIDMQG